MGRVKLGLMSDIKLLTEKIKKFRDARNWMQFHNHKDMALSLVLESAEILEHFQWKSPQEVIERAKTHKSELEGEIADVAIYLFELADNLGIDIKRAVYKKLTHNNRRYSVKRSKGSAKKYTELS